MKFFAYSGLIKKFAKLSQFKSLKDFNNNVEKWLADHKQIFTKSELVALKRLIRYCAKYHGVSNAKIQTLVAATHKMNDMNGISRSTLIRMLNKAKAIGLLNIQNTERLKGGQGHNIYVFKRYFATIETPYKRILKQRQNAQSKQNRKPECIILTSEAFSLYETNNIKNNNIKIPHYNWLNESTEEEKLMIEYQKRQRQIREQNKNRIPNYNWLTS